jgi:hypothetical protein
LQQANAVTGAVRLADMPLNLEQFLGRVTLQDPTFEVMRLCGGVACRQMTSYMTPCVHGSVLSQSVVIVYITAVESQLRDEVSRSIAL